MSSGTAALEIILRALGVEGRVGLSLWSLETGYPLALPLQWLAIACALVTSVWQLVLVSGRP